jgi:hypothetical protein
VAGTATKSQQDRDAEQVADVLDGLPPLGSKVNLEESEDFARETIARSARQVGQSNLSASEVERILHTPLAELELKYQAVANLSLDSFATSSMEGDPSSNTLSLVTVSAEALEDGEISKEEAAAIAISAAKAAGSVVAAASGSLAFGPLGAVAASDGGDRVSAGADRREERCVGGFGSGSGDAD